MIALKISPGLKRKTKCGDLPPTALRLAEITRIEEIAARDLIVRFFIVNDPLGVGQSILTE